MPETLILSVQSFLPVLFGYLGIGLGSLAIGSLIGHAITVRRTS